MIPILKSNQIRSADQYTIENEPIGSLQLMERASESFVNEFTSLVAERNPIIVVSGTGNNGGDGLAIARLLCKKSYHVDVYVIGDPEKGSPDFRANLQRLPAHHHVITNNDDFPVIREDHVLIEGIFGSGLSRPVTGLYGELIDYINQFSKCTYSIDIASGLFADNLTPKEGAIIEPLKTISFQVPKLVFFMPGLHKYVGDWRTVSIGLDHDFISRQPTDHHLLEQKDIYNVIPQSSTFDHKGDNGRVHLIAGSRGKMGAAVMAARAAMRSGTGLLHVHVPGCGVDIVQSNVPEAMCIPADGTDQISKIRDLPDVVAIGLGPGLGTDEKTGQAIMTFIREIPADIPMVWDADALNILSTRPEMYQFLGQRAILTPHPGEFRRLAGSWENDFEKLELLQSFCNERDVHVVLKGAYSTMCSPGGKIIFNSSGNPGMATAGSGDVLLGMVASFLGQGISLTEALQSAVYLHGRAGDHAKDTFGMTSMIATDIINSIPQALKELDKELNKNQ